VLVEFKVRICSFNRQRTKTFSKWALSFIHIEMIKMSSRRVDQKIDVVSANHRVRCQTLSNYFSTYSLYMSFCVAFAEMYAFVGSCFAKAHVWHCPLHLCRLYRPIYQDTCPAKSFYFCVPNKRSTPSQSTTSVLVFLYQLDPWFKHH